MLDRGAVISAFDPVALEAGSARLADHAAAAGSAGAVEAAGSVATACSGADAVLVATEWPEFKLLDWAAIAATMRGTVIVDGRRIVDAEAASHAGLRVISLGVEVKGAAPRPAG